MKRGLIFIVCLGISSVVLAQPAAPSTPSGFDANANLANMNTSMFRTFDNRYEGVKGFATVFEDFVYGNVNMTSGERAEGQELNYDAVTNELIVRSRIYKKVLAVRHDLVVSFELVDDKGDTLFFKKVMEGKAFHHVVYESKRMNMYIKYGKSVLKANYGGAYNANARNYDEFTEDNVFLFSKEGEALEAIKPGRKAFEEKFPNQKDLIKKYFKDNKPDMKKYRDIQAFLTFLDSNI